MPPSPQAVVRDLRALGWSAPLRAAYEASKRSGFHTLLFREIPARGLRSRSLGIAGAAPKSETARQRCLEDAASIVRQGVRVFGHRVPTGVHTGWNVDPLTGAEWPQEEKWWRIDIRSGDRLSDVKWVWEAGRHRDLVVLARAAMIEPHGPWLTELEAMLCGWLQQCRPERGVHWYSSLELALRAIAWAQVLELVGHRLGTDIRGGVDAQLLASARHIMLELPYTVSSMKNNHLLGDGLGLVVLGRMFPDHSASRRWQRIGDGLFLKQLARHMRDDGSMIEDSLSYHRFVMEMLIVRVLLGQAAPQVHDALKGAAHHLQRLGVLCGDVPQYGDWDEGRVLADSQPAGSVAGSTWAALGLSGYDLPVHAWDEYDEVAWYVDPETNGTGTPLPSLAPARRAGDFRVLEHEDLRVWVKSGTGPSHQHADIGSVWIQRQGEWLTHDPGTGTYNGPIAVRNGFRTSAAHPVWRPEGADQLMPHRAFRWLRTVNVDSVSDIESGSDRLVLVVHDAFTSEPERSRVARLVHLNGDALRVVDFIESRSERRWLMSVPLGSADALTDLCGLGSDILQGEETPFRGWHSETYGQWEPSTWTEVKLSGKSHAWGLGITEIERADDSVCVDGTNYRVAWEPERVKVEASLVGGASLSLEVRDV